MPKSPAAYLLQADARQIPLADASVQCVVTSPPYWGLRDYGMDGQIGLEPTPDLYVAHLIAVFREVRRVLRDDGTVWLNLGDSYAANRSYQVPDSKHVDVGNGMGSNVPVGLKPKDLCMIPARVALALQAPYYTGKIASERDRVWLAGIVDGEGCIYISRSKEGAITGRGRMYTRTRDAFDVGVKITNTNRALIEECRRILGHGNVREASNHGRQAFEVALYSSRARELLRELYPYLVAKQHEARLAIGCPPSGDKATAAHEALKNLHNGAPASVDFTAPQSMYEPGWYLRSDIIWSKPNPMPESITDRPTKSHEYLFLLSKAARYYYDAEAIKETALNPNGEHTTSIKSFGTQAAGAGVAPSGNQIPGTTWTWGSTRNRRSVWTIATEPYPEAHFATFPEKLVEPCILAGTSERGACPTCGAAWGRDLEHEIVSVSASKRSSGNGDRNDAESTRTTRTTRTTAWSPSCACPPAEPVPCRVLDPFAGSGTTVAVAERLGRVGIGLELKPDYIELARKRTAQAGLL